MLQIQRILKASLMIAGLFLLTAAYADTKTDVKNAYEGWCSAIGTAKGNANEVVKYYAPNATLLPTLSSKILVNRNQGLNDYFTTLTKNPDLKCTTNKLMTDVYGDIATNVGLYTFSFKDDGKVKKIPCRFSFVYKKMGDQWLIINHHSSQFPEKMSS